MKRLHWRAGVAYTTGWLGGQVWFWHAPDPDPWVRIPAAVLTAAIVFPISAWIWGWVFPERSR